MQQHCAFQKYFTLWLWNEKIFSLRFHLLISFIEKEVNQVIIHKVYVYISTAIINAFIHFTVNEKNKKNTLFNSH